jgi:hypothetical protein
MCTLLHVLGITGKSLGSALLHKTIVKVHKRIVNNVSIVLYNCALPGDGPVRPKTCRSLHYYNFNKGCAFVGLHYNKLQIIPVIVSINIRMKVWCVCVRARACPHFHMGATSVLLPLIVEKLQWTLTWNPFVVMWTTVGLSIFLWNMFSSTMLLYSLYSFLCILLEICVKILEFNNI